MSAEEFDINRRGYSPARRRFLNMICLGLGGIVSGMIAVPIVAGYIAPLYEAYKGVWRRIGTVSDFPVGDFKEVTFLNPDVPWGGITSTDAAWVRREPNNQFTALTIYCQHLGCPVRWEPGAQLFFCPCHGGVYYANGGVAGGPPERGLPHFPVRVRNSHVEIFTARIPYP